MINCLTKGGVLLNLGKGSQKDSLFVNRYLYDMKLLITENQLETLNELTGEFEKETEIIYKDRNIVCLIPKSQMSSNMYGKGTKWCQIRKMGFDMWSKRGLLIRFLFRGGKKIRFTYFFPDGGHDLENEDYYWANENGYHVLHGEGNPFDAKTKRERVRDTELDILAYINIIPEECKNKVLEFINQHRKEYDYCYSREEFAPKKEKAMMDAYQLISQKYGKKLQEMQIYFYFNLDKKKFEIIDYNKDVENRNEQYYDIDSFQRRITELLMQKPTNNKQEKGYYS